MKILRRADYGAMPWKNGGGITHEVARVPAQGEPFQWRLSLARIDQSGAFSDFTGYLRIMLLLEGEGFVLRSPGEPDRTFRPGEAEQRFDGALPMQCELTGGACTDLNLMVRHACQVSTRIARLDAPLTLRTGGTLILFALAGSCRIEDGTRQDALESWDTAIAEPGQRIMVHPARSGQAPARLFIASVR